LKQQNSTHGGGAARSVRRARRLRKQRCASSGAHGVRGIRPGRGRRQPPAAAAAAATALERARARTEASAWLVLAARGSRAHWAQGQQQGRRPTCHQEGVAGGPGALALLAGLIHVKVQHVAHGEPLPFVFSPVCLLSILMLINFCS